MQCGILRISKYDLRFIQNLHLITVNKNSLTTNQVILFDKLIQKYHRQLTKHGVTKLLLSNLKWETTIVPSDPKYTEAYISVQDNKIIFRSPFNKKFLEKFNKNNFNPFKWIKEQRVYESSFSTQALKYIIEIAKDYYPKINFCKITQVLLDDVSKYDAEIWEPTLVNCNGRHLISGINSKLYESISNIELNSDPEVLASLSSFGIMIDEKIINNDPLLKFASSYINEVDFTNTDLILDHIEKINCNSVFILGYGMSLQYKRVLVEKLKKRNFTIYEKSSVPNDDVKSKSVMICFSNEMTIQHNGFLKILIMKNSSPIRIT